MIQVLLLTALILAITRYLVKRHIFYSHLKSFPSPKGWPFIGILFEFMDQNNSVASLLKYMQTLGPNFVLTIGNTTALLLNNPNDIEFLLGSSTMINKSDEYKLFKSWFGDGLLTSKGYKWKSHRKILTPGFHYTILQDFVKIFNKSSRKLVENLKEEKRKEFDVFDYVTLHTLDIICETAMGVEINSQSRCNSEFLKGIKEMCDIEYRRCFSIFLRFDFSYQFSSTYRREKKLLKMLQGFSNSIIEKRRKVLLQNRDMKSNPDCFGMKSKNTFLDILLLANIDGKPLTNKEIREEVDTFIFEGHDTTAVAISFALYCLSKNPEVQKNAYQEIKDVFGNDILKEADYEILQNLKYLEMVIKETLRLYPSVGVFSRALEENVKYGEITIPKDLSILLCPYSLHRSPDLYPDPEKFCPERFTLENQAKRHPYAYIPFSAGPRNCIGQKFAMLEIKSTLVEILRNFEILPALGEVHIISKITLQSSNGIKIGLKKRE